MTENKKGNAWALVPLIIFVGIFLGVGVITGDFSIMPLNVAIIIASIVGLLIYKKETFSKKIDVFTKGAGHSYIILMMLFIIIACFFAHTSVIKAVDYSRVFIWLTIILLEFI